MQPSRVRILMRTARRYGLLWQRRRRLVVVFGGGRWSAALLLYLGVNMMCSGIRQERPWGGPGYVQAPALQIWTLGIVSYQVLQGNRGPRTAEDQYHAGASCRADCMMLASAGDNEAWWDGGVNRPLTWAARPGYRVCCKPCRWCLR